MLLRQMLYRCDTRLLPVIGSYWVSMHPMPAYEELIRILCPLMLNPAHQQRIMAGLTEDARQALKQLASGSGIIPTEAFEKQFGSFRILGMDRILREKPWLHSPSAVEELWYRGFIFTENRLMESGVHTCYLIPEDMLKILRQQIDISTPAAQEEQPLLVRPAVPSETSRVLPLHTQLPDMFCLAAAFQRNHCEPEFPGMEFSPQYRHFLNMLLREAQCFSTENEANPEQIRELLISNRIFMTIRLVQSWADAQSYDELIESPEFAENQTNLSYDKAALRKRTGMLISHLTPGNWYSLNGFVSAVRQRDKLFLRSSIQDEQWHWYDKDGNDLNGIGAWYQMEGAWLRFLISGPLYWLGIIQLSLSDEKNISAFRLNTEGRFYLLEGLQKDLPDRIRQKPNLEKSRPTVSPDGTITCSFSVPRYFRYTVCRCCELVKISSDCCVFRITPGSLNQAEREGILRTDFLTLLQHFCGESIPSSVRNLLNSSKKSSLSAAIYTATLLTVPESRILVLLQEDSKLERFILQQLTPTTLLIDPKGIEPIRRWLMENEILVDIQQGRKE